jgi:hypothetical protein
VIEEAPTNEPVKDGWTNGWTRWFKLIQLSLSGWRGSKTTSLTHDFGAIGAGLIGSTTATVSGARAGDGVQITGASTTGIIYYGVVTANNTVTIYAQNVTSGSINPASTTFRIIVFMQ